jgi:hypothetical protein
MLVFFDFSGVEDAASDVLARFLCLLLRHLAGVAALKY